MFSVLTLDRRYSSCHSELGLRKSVSAMFIHEPFAGHSRAVHPTAIVRYIVLSASSPVSCQSGPKSSVRRMWFLEASGKGERIKRRPELRGGLKKLFSI